MDHTGLLPRSHSGLAADPNPLGSGYWLFDKSSPLSAPPVSYDSDLIPTLILWCTGSEFILHFIQGSYRYLVCIYSVETSLTCVNLPSGNSLHIWEIRNSSLVFTEVCFYRGLFRSLHLCCSFTSQILTASTYCGSVFGVIGLFILLCSLMKNEKGQKEGQASW